MHENHQKEQYFFDEATITALTDFSMGFERICCLCTPTIGEALLKRGKACTILDTDERFADLPGFRSYDLYRPDYLPDTFDLIICDPPFFNVSLSQLFKAIRILAHFNLEQPLLLAYLGRRRYSVTGTFAPFGLRQTEKKAHYLTVQSSAKNDIYFFSNLPPSVLDALEL